MLTLRHIWHERKLRQNQDCAEHSPLHNLSQSSPQNRPDRKWGGGGGGGNSGLDSKVVIFGYFFICLNVLFFAWLNSSDRYTFHTLAREDNLVENLTAIWFFLASLLFFITAGTERNVFHRTVYILGGITMLFVVGEEISWGQRIVGFSTPDFLLDLNEQREFNLHNMRGSGSRNWIEYTTVTFCTVTCIAFFCDKKFLFGVPVPPVLLALGSMTTIQWTQRVSALPTEFILSLLILFVVIYAFISRRAELIIASISAATLALTVSYVVDDKPKAGSEMHEYVIGIVCVLFSIELALSQESVQRKVRRLRNGVRGPLQYHLYPRRTVTGQKGPVMPEARLRKSGICYPSAPLTVCSVVVACSIGLTLFHYFDDGVVAPSGEPAVRSTFDIYLTENRVIYFKEPCDSADIEELFFLHLTPANVSDLPAFRVQYGFDNLDFEFVNIGTRSDGRCLAAVALPRYAIVSIRTGQYIPGKGHVWRAEFPFRE